MSAKTRLRLIEGRLPAPLPPRPSGPIPPYPGLLDAEEAREFGALAGRLDWGYWGKPPRWRYAAGDLDCDELGRFGALLRKGHGLPPEDDRYESPYPCAACREGCWRWRPRRTA